jgi:small conductance mechanosensitive channel
MPPNPFQGLTWETALSQLGTRILNGLLDSVLALLILIAGVWLSGWLASFVRRAAKRSERLDDTLASFLASAVRYGLMAIVLIAVLDQFGVETTQIVAVLGAATLAIGLALQGTLSNVAAGVMLILFRPYRLGDFVEVAGRKGVIKEISLFTTELATPDNVKLVLPNAQCWGAPIANFTAHEKRAIMIDVATPRTAPLSETTDVLHAVIKSDPRVLSEPAPNVAVSMLGDQTVTLQAVVWCATKDVVALKAALLGAIKDALEQANIPTPYPTTVAYNYDMGAFKDR